MFIYPNSSHMRMTYSNQAEFLFTTSNPETRLSAPLQRLNISQVTRPVQQGTISIPRTLGQFHPSRRLMGKHRRNAANCPSSAHLLPGLSRHALGISETIWVINRGMSRGSSPPPSPLVIPSHLIGHPCFTHNFLPPFSHYRIGPYLSVLLNLFYPFSRATSRSEN